MEISQNFVAFSKDINFKHLDFKRLTCRIEWAGSNLGRGHLGQIFCRINCHGQGGGTTTLHMITHIIENLNFNFVLGVEIFSLNSHYIQIDVTWKKKSIQNGYQILKQSSNKKSKFKKFSCKVLLRLVETFQGRDHPYITSVHIWTFSDPPSLRQHKYHLFIIIDILWGQPIKLAQVASTTNCLKINKTTLFSSK